MPIIGERRDMASRPVTALHVDIHEGPPPALLLVHGLLSSRAQWRPNLSGLSEVCTPIVVELLGHGRSPSPADPAAYAVEAYVDAFEEVRAGLGLERWFVCGQSFGAGLTLRYALAHPDRVAGQVFTNSMSGLAPPGRDDAAQRKARAEAFRRGGRAALEAMPLYPRGSRRWPAEVSRGLVEDAALLSAEGVANAIAYTLDGLSMAEDLAGLTMPSLLVNGRREAAFQPLRDLAAARLPGLEIVDLDGGHSINLDCPEAFNAAVAEFIRRHSG
ncbi:MAG TPA: alpha/beta fold hydrolase [Caulobacteraceae bacterium]|jgi:pimeloyl-ACP methyl ester carboxylesterase|nr:alpha/beta fold hydrolase [Caulobacteraceae bacterium]